MSYREIPVDKILRFPSTPGFKGWKDWFTDESTTHPAKMNLNLLRHILEAHTRPGDVVLDPMAGTGSTVVLASMLGRHGIAVEYEPHFCDMIRENIKRTKPQSSLILKGSMTCIQGDSRELSKLLKESDAIITSPPYEGSVPAYDEKWLEEHWDDESDSPKHKTMRFGRSTRGYPKKVDAVVSSPPYGNRLADDVVQDGDEARMSYRQAVDSIVTSPPYEDTQTIQDFEAIKFANLKRGRKLSDIESWSMKDEGYGPSSSNIGNLKSESYLEAMLQCYREFFAVLKKGGIMVLVVKNFIRDKAVVRLDLDTIRLAEAVGFTLKDRWYFKLPTKSFWRLLYERKFPETPKLLYEDVLIFGKEAGK